MKKYQVALSFASEDLELVERIAKGLKLRNISFFYSNDVQAELWGKDIYQYLSNLYTEEAQYTVIFISQNYANKMWTKHELQSAQSRAFRESEEYILPIRIDDTKLPGIRDTIAFIDSRKVSAEEICNLILKKFMPTFDFKHKIVTEEISNTDKTWLLQVDTGEIMLAFNLDEYESIEDILNDLYFYYLKEKVSPFSYGSEWVLTISEKFWGKNLYIVPCEWIENPKKPVGNSTYTWPTNIVFNKSIFTKGKVLKVNFDITEHDCFLVLKNGMTNSKMDEVFIKRLYFYSHNSIAVPELPHDYVNRYHHRLLLKGFNPLFRHNYNILICR